MPTKVHLVKAMVFPLIAQLVKNLPAMQETQVWEDPLEKETATHFSIVVWRIPWTEEPSRLHGAARVGHNFATKERKMYGCESWTIKKA